MFKTTLKTQPWPQGRQSNRRTQSPEKQPTRWNYSTILDWLRVGLGELPEHPQRRRLVPICNNHVVGAPLTIRWSLLSRRTDIDTLSCLYYFRTCRTHRVWRYPSQLAIWSTETQKRLYPASGREKQLGQELFPWIPQGQDPWHAWHTTNEMLRQTEVSGRGQNRRNHGNYEKIISKRWKWIPWHSIWLTKNSVYLRRKYTRRTQDGRKRNFLLFTEEYYFHEVCAYVWGSQQGREYRMLDLLPKLPT